MPDARLIDVSVPHAPDGVVLVLHGGASRGAPTPVSPAQLSVLRMIPVAHRVARVGRGRLAVLRLLNSLRGWDSAHTPVHDVEWALAEIAGRFGSHPPVALVGHSLGGRAALLSAGRPQVHGVVALAPWVEAGDAGECDVTGTPIVIIHGDADRVALPGRSRSVAETLRRQTTVAYVTVTGAKHAMLTRTRCFDGLSAQSVAWMLLGETTDPIVARIAAGEDDISV